MDEATEELSRAHDAIAEFYADRLPAMYALMPVDLAVLDLFCTLVCDGDAGRAVGDVGCGPGALVPYLSDRGLEPHGVDLSPEMVRVARRDHPGIPFEVADVRSLPFADASLAGALGWYSLMYLAPNDRPRAFAELARDVRPGGHLVTGFKVGDDSLRRGAVASASSSTSTGSRRRRWNAGSPTPGSGSCSGRVAPPARRTDSRRGT